MATGRGQPALFPFLAYLTSDLRLQGSLGAYHVQRRLYVSV